MIGGSKRKPAELLTLRVRPRDPKTIDEDQTRREDHHQPPRQIHLSRRGICPKKRSHPSLSTTGTPKSPHTTWSEIQRRIARWSGPSCPTRSSGAHPGGPDSSPRRRRWHEMPGGREPLGRAEKGGATLAAPQPATIQIDGSPRAELSLFCSIRCVEARLRVRRSTCLRTACPESFTGSFR